MKHLGLTLLGVSALVAWVGTPSGHERLPLDAGAGGALQKIRKLQTTASVMHTTAHPDDEYGGTLAMLSRGRGARVSLLTLTRGESGDNAIGSELFDAVGLLRTEELLRADQYYGVDAQYFTTAVDYGFSKRLDEALEKWGRENVLRDVVRIIRAERPFVVISRFQGNERDGHGNHQAAGVVTREAFAAAGDPRMFPDQIAEGVRPWQPLKLYMGGVRDTEDWTIAADAGEYDPVLGDSYQNVARIGLSFQRSQNSGVLRLQPGASIAYYKRLDTTVEAPAREASFFDGIDVTIPGIYRALRKPAPEGADARLSALDREIKAAAASFTMTAPSAAAPALARALAAARAALATLGSDPAVASILKTKESQIQDALGAVLGIDFTAVAQPADAQEPSEPFAAFAAPATMGAPVPGGSFSVRASFTNRSPVKIESVKMALAADKAWKIDGGGADRVTAVTNQPLVRRFAVVVPANAPLSRPYFSRDSIDDSRYTLSDRAQFSRPSTEAPLWAVATYDVGGVNVETRVPVTRLESNLPNGYDTRVLAVVPAIALTLTPASAVVAVDAADRTLRLRAEIVNNREGKTDGTVSLKLPDGWSAQPASQAFAFSRAGERGLFPFVVMMPAVTDRAYTIDGVAVVDTREYREGYDVMQHRDLETRYLYHPASVRVRGLDVKIAPGLKVGYVMGIGDDVPSGIAQLGADVQLLGPQDLASGDLGRFDAIVTGTRAYAVREDLKTHNRRLLDYVRNGGNWIVLYNTQELVPNLYAPFPAELPRNAEEVSEEDSPITILAPSDPVFNTPNTITAADFEHWVEQRGSKFWSRWDPSYTPMISTFDRGQAPQRGGWLHARYGKGHYTYFAYAFHRQLPYGVAGAYRLLANLLSLSKSDR